MNTTINNLPALSNEGGLSAYLEQIKKFPMLAAEEEYMLAKNWKTTGNIKAAEKLVTSHLRLVAKIAMGYKGYGLPVNEMISEGNIGLMQAVKKFEPEKGFRLATYAMWWIKASIQEYILRSWSLVKIGTTTAQKKLFFNLKKLKNQISPQSEGDLRDEHVNEIADKLDVLDHLDEIKICVQYDLEGKKIDYLPAAVEDQLKIKPIYKTFAGWKSSTNGIRNINDLPENAKKYIFAIEDFIGAKISSISTSPERDDTILVENPYDN